MSMGKYILIHITATTISGNPYRDVESPNFKCKMLYYAYFDEAGNQIGRSKHIQLDRVHIPAELADDIQKSEVIKIAWDAGKTRIYASQIIGYTPHHYIDPSGWIDMRTLARINGCAAESIMKTASYYSVYSKADLNNDRFPMVLKILNCITKDKLINLPHLSSYYVNQSVNDKGVLLNNKVLSAGVKLIKLYYDAINDFSLIYEYPVDSNRIKRELLEKYGVSDDDESIYTLLDTEGRLTDMEKGLIHIYRFINSSTVKAINKCAAETCSDGYLRGLISCWSDTMTGRYGGTSFFDRICRYPQIDLDILIKHISYIDKVSIHDSEIIIYYLNYE